MRINLINSIRSTSFRLQSPATISQFTQPQVTLTVNALLKYTYLKNPGTAHKCTLYARTESHWCSNLYCQHQFQSLLPCFPIRTEQSHRWRYGDAGVRQGWWLNKSPGLPQGAHSWKCSHQRVCVSTGSPSYIINWTFVNVLYILQKVEWDDFVYTYLHFC